MISQIITAGLSIIDKVVPDPTAKAEAQVELLRLSQEGGLKELESAMNIITAEAKSEHWIVASWRPITMLTFVAIVANNYIVYPYLSLFWHSAPMLSIPTDLWDLLKLGISGYVVGRSGEKIAIALSKK